MVITCHHLSRRALRDTARVKYAAVFIYGRMSFAILSLCSLVGVFCLEGAEEWFANVKWFGLHPWSGVINHPKRGSIRSWRQLAFDLISLLGIVGTGPRNTFVLYCHHVYCTDHRGTIVGAADIMKQVDEMKLVCFSKLYVNTRRPHTSADLLMWLVCFTVSSSRQNKHLDLMLFVPISSSWSRNRSLQ